MAFRLVQDRLYQDVGGTNEIAAEAVLVSIGDAGRRDRYHLLRTDRGWRRVEARGRKGSRVRAQRPGHGRIDCVADGGRELLRLASVERRARGCDRDDYRRNNQSDDGRVL